ncbi:hypothetical protein BC826DRAFT_691327 [Russula brevipes]|nr:hypothetical protein BC826DRAFT_691327 [Russula brevipes]
MGINPSARSFVCNPHGNNLHHAIVSGGASGTLLDTVSSGNACDLRTKIRHDGAHVLTEPEITDPSVLLIVALIVVTLRYPNTASTSFNRCENRDAAEDTSAT